MSNEQKYVLRYKYTPKFVSNENPIFFGSELASGFDLFADLETSVCLSSLDRFVVPTGLYFDLWNSCDSYFDLWNPSIHNKTKVIYDEYYVGTISSNFILEVQVRSRSGLAAKNGIIVLNSPGTIDNDYTGEIKVILINLSKEDFVISPNMRIAQCVPSFIPQRQNEILKIERVEELKKTKRNEGGFGSTGV